MKYGVMFKDSGWEVLDMLNLINAHSWLWFSDKVGRENFTFSSQTAALIIFLYEIFRLIKVDTCFVKEFVYPLNFF